MLKNTILQKLGVEKDTVKFFHLNLIIFQNFTSEIEKCIMTYSLKKKKRKKDCTFKDDEFLDFEALTS